MSDTNDDRRQQGILTPQDRRALEGRDTLDVEPIRHARYRIRERVKEAIRDLAFLQWRLPQRDRELIFREFVGADGGRDLRLLLGFVFSGIYENAEEYRTLQGRKLDGPIDVIERLVSHGVYSVEWNRDGFKPDVETDISVDRWRPDPDAAFDRLEQGYGNRGELVYLARWCDDTRILERVVETGEPLRLVLGSHRRFGRECVTELTPDDAAEWLEHFDGPMRTADESP